MLGTLDDLELKNPAFPIISETNIKDVCKEGITFGWFIMDLEDYYDIDISLEDSNEFFTTVKSTSEYLTRTINKRKS